MALFSSLQIMTGDEVVWGSQYFARGHLTARE